MGYAKAQKLKALICCAITILGVDVVNAGMCRWVDEDGCVHYAETCPAGVESTEVEIHAPPSPEQVDEAIKRSADVKLPRSGQEEIPSESTELSTSKIYQMRERCIEARLNLDVLSQKLPVYYDTMGQLRAELWNYPHVRLERSSSYLNSDAKTRAHKRWSKVKQDNCIPPVSGSGIRAAIGRKQKEHQQRLCEAWEIELEFMELRGSFHKERLNLQKLFSSKCK